MSKKVSKGKPKDVQKVSKGSPKLYPKARKKTNVQNIYKGLPNKHREIINDRNLRQIVSKVARALANNFQLQFSAIKIILKATTTRCVVIVERTFVVEIA